MHNRENRHVNARRNFGGIAVLFKNSFICEYDITVIDKSIDGVLVFKFTHIDTMHNVLFIAMYLPPEKSPWGRNAEEHFDNITSLIHMYSVECDTICMCGDFNARIGNNDDFILGLDKINPRIAIDKTNNKHGETLLDITRVYH